MVANSRAYTSRMKLAHRAMNSIVHDKIGDLVLDAKLEDVHNMGMDQVSNRTCLGAKLVNIVTGQPSL
jgi:hypothetical protein